MPRKLILADDHLVIRRGVKLLIDSVDTWELVAEASNGEELIELVEEHNPDAVLLDLHMPELSGFGVLSRLSTLKNPPGVLVFSGTEDPDDAKESLRAGAHGFLSKTAEEGELLKALEKVAKKENYVSAELAAKLAAANSEDSNPFAVLTKRETEIAQLLAKGTPNREIAATLHVSARTVDTHRYNILKKVGASSNAELVSMAVKHRFI